MEISGVKLRNSYQIYYVDTNNLFVKHNAQCVIETKNGIDIGTIIKCPKSVHGQDIEIQGKLLRMANEEDLSKIPDLEETEKKAFKACRKKAAEKKLNMKLISVKFLFDRTKIIFYFVAENRIDFRELVRELAAIFKTRIEMRQIGVRDEARIMDGFGPCGRRLCCSYMKEEFEPVSIKKAKEQSLNLNSIKISGMCGRLLCCLSYEYDTYKELNESLPSVGTSISIDKNNHVYVLSVDTLKEEVTIKMNDIKYNVHNKDIQKNSHGKYYIKKDVIDKLLNPDEDLYEPSPDDEKFEIKE